MAAEERVIQPVPGHRSKQASHDIAEHAPSTSSSAAVTSAISGTGASNITPSCPGSAEQGRNHAECQEDNNGDNDPPQPTHATGVRRLLHMPRGGRVNTVIVLRH